MEIKKSYLTLKSLALRFNKVKGDKITSITQTKNFDFKCKKQTV